jgi:hypothetical protein
MNLIKHISIVILFTFLGGVAGFKYARRQSWLDSYYATGYLRWAAPMQLSQIHSMQEALLENKPKLVNGAINDITVHALIDAHRALEIANHLKETVPIKPPNKSLFALSGSVAYNAAMLQLKPLFTTDAKLQPDAQWDPLNPPNFEIGKYFESIMKEPRERAAKSSGK